jgi:hypothetical protein
MVLTDATLDRRSESVERSLVLIVTGLELIAARLILRRIAVRSLQTVQSARNAALELCAEVLVGRARALIRRAGAALIAARAEHRCERNHRDRPAHRGSVFEYFHCLSS